MEEKLRNSQQAFISTIISHTTHEFKNHLAIINESAGLMADLMGMEGEGGVPNQERYQKIISSITNRVAVASELTLKLNHFGHRMDDPMSSFSLNDLLEEELKLLGRHAGQKQVEIRTDYSASIPAIYNQPSICQYVFFMCFEYMISRFAGPSTMEVSTGLAGEKVQISITCSGTAKEQSEELLDALMQDCRYALTKISAELKNEKKGSNQEIVTLSLMSLPPDKSDDN